MEEQLISFETAKLAKEKNFDESCDWVFEEDLELRRLNYYEGDGSGFVKNSEIDSEYESFIQTAPTQSLLQKWLREEHDIHFEIKPIFEVGERRPYHISVFKNLHGKDFEYNIIGVKDTYERALEAGLQEALKLIK